MDRRNRKDREVVAGRRKALLGIYIFALILAIGLFGGILCGMCLSENPKTVPIAIVATVGALIIGGCLWMLFGILRTPWAAICYEDGKLYFADGFVCSVLEMSDVSLRCASANGFEYRWGKLTVKAADRVYTYKYIAEVESVRDRLLKLQWEYNLKQRNHNG